MKSFLSWAFLIESFETTIPGISPHFQPVFDVFWCKPVKIEAFEAFWCHFVMLNGHRDDMEVEGEVEVVAIEGGLLSLSTAMQPCFLSFMTSLSENGLSFYEGSVSLKGKSNTDKRCLLLLFSSILSLIPSFLPSLLSWFLMKKVCGTIFFFFWHLWPLLAYLFSILGFCIHLFIFCPKCHKIPQNCIVLFCVSPRGLCSEE